MIQTPAKSSSIRALCAARIDLTRRLYRAFRPFSELHFIVMLKNHDRRGKSRETAFYHSLTIPLSKQLT